MVLDTHNSEYPGDKTIESYNIERRLHDLRHDSTIGILKKEGFMDDVRRKDPSTLELLSGPFAIVYYDFDNFKEINDTYGHEKGDLYLRTIVSGIDKNSWEKNGLLGVSFRGKQGDEIVSILQIPSSSSKDYVERINNLKQDVNVELNTLGKTFVESGINRPNPSLSAGAVFFPDGINSSDPEAILASFFQALGTEADKAVYASKATKANRQEGELIDITMSENINHG